MLRGLTMLFPPKPARKRDAHIINQSDFIVAMQLTDEQTLALLSRAEAAGRQVIYLGGLSPRRALINTKTVPKQPAGPARPMAAERTKQPSAPSQRGRSATGKPVSEARFATAEAHPLPTSQSTCVHVGVITGGSSIKGEQLAALASELRKISVPRGGKLVLHHGCASGADTAAHDIVRTIKGWEIHGHPASGSASGPLPPGMGRQLHTVHMTKPREDRDADIARVASIVIFVEPGPPGAKALRAAVAAGGKIINVGMPARKKKIVDVPAPTGRGGSPQHSRIGARATRLPTSPTMSGKPALPNSCAS
jgi:hypothetical protein